jgi:hypothetical protein
MVLTTGDFASTPRTKTCPWGPRPAVAFGWTAELLGEQVVALQLGERPRLPRKRVVFPS